MSLPEHPFWDFSLEFYRQPGVADACLYLQDQYGLNVNIILLCLWAGLKGDVPLTASQLTACQQRIRDWELGVIQPLRAMRRAVRQEPLGVPEFMADAFRPHIEAVELEAEHIEQLLLVEVAGSVALISNPEPAEFIVSNLRAYIEVASVSQDEQCIACLNTLVNAACAGASFVRS